MPLIVTADGTWTGILTDEDSEAVKHSHPSYFEALPRYLNAFAPAFFKAKEKSEFQFLASHFAIRGLQDAGWDPYETTERGISALKELHRSNPGEASQHLSLWVYGHIMEASEPYEFVSNLLDVAVGGEFIGERFPPHKNGAPLSPQTKIERIAMQANSAGLPTVITPMKEAWNRDFRNAIFHADYSLYGLEVRTMRPTRNYDKDEVMTLVNRALAYHDALTTLRNFHLSSYAEPVQIPADVRFTHNPGEMATVIVREGDGARGLKDAWTEDEIRRGCIPFRFGRFTREEISLMNAQPILAFLPAIHPREGSTTT